MSFEVEILRHAATIYTPAIFKMIQSEVSKAYDSSMHIFFEIGEVTEYKLTLYKKCFHTVKYNSCNGTVKCSCKKFEFSGILCSHALKVLSSRNMVNIPAMYILKRWTKHATTGSDRAISHHVTHEDPKIQMGNWYKDLCKVSAEVTTEGAKTEEV